MKKIILVVLLCLIPFLCDAQQIIVTKKKAGGGGCSGSYGNQATIDAGSIGDGSSSECFVTQVTGACDGNTASVSIRWNDLDPSTATLRGRVVVYSDVAGAPSSLLGSAEVTGAAINATPTTRTTPLVVATNATTFWVGACKEALSSVVYSSTTGGTTRTVYNCSSAYSSPPETWGANCTVDNDYNAWNLEQFVTY
jgi:hypothetical protein